VKKVEGGVTVFYVRSSVMKQTAFEVGGNGALYRANVYAGSQKLIGQLSPDGQFYWRHESHLGSGYKLTSSSGTVVYRAEHDPHGQLLLETGSTTLTANKFTSYERDNSTGLDYANARMYSGSRGRFTKPDPAGLSAADARPQSLNQYTYTDNDPVNMIDPSGNDAYYYECRNYRYWYDGWRELEVCELRRSPRQAEPGESGSHGGVGGGDPPSQSREARLLQEAIQDVIDILSGDSECSKLFRGTVGIDALNSINFTIQPITRPGERSPVNNGNIGISMRVTDEIPANMQYRIPVSAIVNSIGGFFQSAYIDTSSGSPVTRNVPNFGGYGSNNRAVRALMLLHEIGHLILAGVGDGKPFWLLLDDTGNTSLSEQNTETVVNACREQLDRLR
jgi:RHS repeat-associated protein